MTKNQRIYTKEFGGSMLAYVIVVIVARKFVGSDATPMWVVAVALAPVVPIGFATWAIMRAFRRMDELDQKIHVEALVFAFTGSALACFAYGLLDESVVPPLSGLWVFMLMMVLRGIGQLLAKRRYR